MFPELNGARLRRSDGGVNPAGRNTGPGWQIFSNNKTPKERKHFIIKTFS